MKWKRLHNILKHMGYKKSYCSSIAVQENKKVIQNIDISTIVWLLLYGEPEQNSLFYYIFIVF